MAMSEAQFAAMMKVISDNQTALLKKVTEAFQSTPGTSQVVTSVKNDRSHMIPFDNFNSKEEKFSSYIERFEDHLDLKQISDEGDKAKLLRNSVGTSNYNSLVAYLGPNKPIKELSYEVLKQSFADLLSPKKSVVVSQHYFLNNSQKEKQPVTDYVATLQKDIGDCKFEVECKCECGKEVKASANELFLRAQFIRGLKDSWLREQLLQSTTTSFDEILGKAIALESSRIESKELEKPPEPADINKVKINSKRLPRLSPKENRTTAVRNRTMSQSTPREKHTRSYSTSRPRRKIDYATLGIDGLCFKCGRDNHKAADCRCKRESLRCEKCEKIGHVAKVCITSLMRNSSSKKDAVHNVDLYYENSDEYDYGFQVNAIEVQDSKESVTVHNIEDDKYYAVVYINGKPQRMEVDSGAKYSVISSDEFEKLQLSVRLEPSNMVFRSWTKNTLPVLGTVRVQVRYKKKVIKSVMYVVPPGHATLLGRVWIRALKIDLWELDRCTQKQKSSQSESCVYNIRDIDGLIREYPEVFEEKIGCIPNVTVELELREGAKPVYIKERNIPYALREQVNQELDDLEKATIITPIESSDWGSPLVVIPKPNKNVRLVADYKVAVNGSLVSVNAELPKSEEVLQKAQKGKVFCKVDLFKAYLHLLVSKRSALIQAISTHRGTYAVNRLGPGIKSAPSIFNREMRRILKNLDGVVFYFDDILIFGDSVEDCEKNLRSCLKVLKENDLHVNRKKCIFFQEEIEYLGYVIRHGEIRKSLKKVEAVQKMPRPKTTDEVHIFLGLVTYYSKFLPNFSEISAPIRRLLCKNVKFRWSAECEAAFIKLKQEICSDRVLVPFDPALPIILTTDASPHGVGAVLSHQINGEERPIAYASRSLTRAEENYSQLDREALGIMFGVTRFYMYVYGVKFTLVTDNAPLTHIFRPDKALPKMTNARLLRFASFLSGFDFEIKFKKGSENTNVDALSRAPLAVPESRVHAIDTLSCELDEYFHEQILQISNESITASTIAEETKKDSELSKILKEIMSSDTKSEYTISDGILFKGERVVIPVVLRSQILAELHECHVGIQKMKQLARSYVTWSGIDKEIERLVKSCAECAKNQSNPKKASVHPWDTPAQNWERIHIDHAGRFQGHWFLVVVDARSKWAEVGVEKSAPTTESTIRLLNQIFSVHGYPQVMVSDNATIFKSSEFRSYCSKHGIKNKYIAPNFPSTNGLAERNVQTLKRRLAALEEDPELIELKIQKILLKYRATPLVSGKSPAENYFGRKIRIRLDAIFPQKLVPRPAQPNLSQCRTLKVAERVQVRILRPQINKQVWEFGAVQRVLGRRHYLVKLDSGRVIKRHIDQMKSTLVPEKRVKFVEKTQYPIPGRELMSRKLPAQSRQNPVQNQNPVVAPAPPVRRSNRIRRAPVRLQDYYVSRC